MLDLTNFRALCRWAAEERDPIKLEAIISELKNILIADNEKVDKRPKRVA